jgi:hypothetical protein
MRSFTYEAENLCLDHSKYFASQLNWSSIIVVAATMRKFLKPPSSDIVRHYASALQAPLDRRDGIIIPAFLALYLVLDGLSFVHPLGDLQMLESAAARCPHSACG